MIKEMKTFKPVPYEFPFIIKEDALDPKCIEYYFFSKNADACYIYTPSLKSVYTFNNSTFLNIIARDVEFLEDAKEFIYKDYKKRKNENV
jgi:hypothetical protein